LKQSASIFAADNTIVELKFLIVMAGLFIMFVMTVALSGLVNDYLQSVSDSDDSVPTPLIVFTTDDDNSDWQKDGE
jgi:hypothetical protein